MRVVDPGHSYRLRELDGGESSALVFVKREGPRYPGNVGHHPGTTSQEVLRALIDRSDYVHNQIPCAETQAVTGLLRAALLMLELRAARRHERFLDLVSMRELDIFCEMCGHVGCSGQCVN